jgi:hypothetical protein
VVGNFARVLLLSRVIVYNVPEFAGRPSVPVERLLYLTMIEDFGPVGAVDFQHSERLYNYLYFLLL